MRSLAQNGMAFDREAEQPTADHRNGVADVVRNQHLCRQSCQQLRWQPHPNGQLVRKARRSSSKVRPRAPPIRANKEATLCYFAQALAGLGLSAVVW